MAKLVLLVCLLSIPLVFGEAPGTTWHVDGSVSQSGNGTSWATALQTIQEGITLASQGDTIIVARGSYAENIRFLGKNITLRSTDPLQSAVVRNTIIEGGEEGSVVNFAGTENEGCVLSGFMIRGGRDANSGGGINGGTSTNPTHATIQNNRITGNSAYQGGGLANCAGIIRNNTISGNSAWLYGGGLAGCHGEIRNNTISNNSAQDSGGGLYDCDGSIESNIISSNSGGRTGGGLKFCDGIMRKNTITQNTAEDYGGGLYHCGGEISDNTIAGNAVGWQGGGLSYCGGTIQNNTVRSNWATAGAGLDGCDGTIRNNLITGNSASTVGGGLKFCDGVVRNNTVVGNSAGTVGGGVYYCRGTIRNCIIWGNAASLFGEQIDGSSTPSFSCIEDWSGGGEENLSEDPMFADADGADDNPATHADNDYRLSSASPCVDQGLNEDWMWEAVDLDGNPRVFRGRSSLTVDMGAFEYGSFFFRIVHLAKTAETAVQITWSSRPGDTYSVWSCLDLVLGVCTEEASVPSQGDTTSWTDTNALAGLRFYIVATQ